MAKKLSRSDMAASLRSRAPPLRRASWLPTVRAGYRRPHGANASSSAPVSRPHRCHLGRTGAAGYAYPMEGAGHTQVRLAELVASLALRVALGSGQPMEHVLRQCLIALRLAERRTLSEQDRAAVYYTALLVNVGCHSD